MRLATILFVLLSVPLTAHGQEAGTIQQVQPAPVARPAPMPPPRDLADGRRIATAFLPNDAIPGLRNLESYPDQVRTYMMAAPEVRTLSKEEKARLAAYSDRLGAVIDEVAIAALPAVRDRMAWDYMSIFTDAEATQFADFIESSAGKSFIKAVNDTAVSGVEQGTVEGGQTLVTNLFSMPEDDLAAFIKFSKTPAGVAYKRSGDNLAGSLARHFGHVLQPRVMTRIRKDTCETVSPKLCSIWTR